MIVLASASVGITLSTCTDSIQERSVSHLIPTQVLYDAVTSLVTSGSDNYYVFLFHKYNSKPTRVMFLVQITKGNSTITKGNSTIMKGLDICSTCPVNVRKVRTLSEHSEISFARALIG